MRISIRKWYGRFGNNIMQVKNALHIAIHCKYHSVHFPEHSFLENRCIIVYPGADRKKILIDESGFEFFDRKTIKNIDKEIFSQNQEKVRELLINNFNFREKDIIETSEKELIIHIRGGDIFQKKTNKNYIMPPFSYYKNIIDNGNYTRIHILSEDKKNPTIGKILENYKNSSFRKKSLIEDMGYILGATNLVESFGTFTPMLIILSRRLKNLYKPSYQGHYMELKDVNVNKIDLEDYRKKQFPWETSPKNIEIMLNYK